MNILYSQTPSTGAELLLKRRGNELGWIEFSGCLDMPSREAIKLAWDNNQAIILPSILAKYLPAFEADITQAHWLMEQTLAGVELASLLDTYPYKQRLEPDLFLSGSSYEENDNQGIEKIIFDAWQNDDIVAENLWCKASWLSFDNEDCSLRYRFSFGMEGYEDVTADHERQLWASKVTEAVFPESSAITENAELLSILTEMLETKDLAFTERIIYFNAPNGGAQMHHDVERGHEGVVFAQMSGSTFWLALSKPTLLDEISDYLMGAPITEWIELRDLAADRMRLANYLDEPDHEIVEALIDRDPSFIRQLIDHGYAYVLRPGDVILMPQRSLDSCVWHSVICLGDTPGEGLSFAIKKLPA